MFNLGPFELVAIFVVALLVFGPDKLPEMGRQVGKAVREFRKFQAQMETNVRDVIDPITGPLTSNGGMGPQPTNIRDSGTVSGAAPGPNVPRSATIQNPDEEAEGEGEDAAPPGSFGYYAPVDQPQAAPQNGPAGPASDETAAAPPDRPADPDTETR